MQTEPKFVVFLSQLLLLFNVFPSCNNPDPLVEVTRIGTMAKVVTICTIIYIYWNNYQKRIFTELKTSRKGIVVSGDGRHDSMGHSAKYCAYTIFCCSSPLIIHFDIIQVRNIQMQLFWIILGVKFYMLLKLLL